MILMGVVLTVVGVELALRATTSQTEVFGGYWDAGAFELFDASGYRHSPDYVGRATRTGVFESSVALDELGLRHGESGRPTGDEMLLVLGDSFPFGLGVAESETLPSRLGDLLPGTAVVNGGQSGFSLGQSTAFGQWLLGQVQPNAVLLTAFLANDLSGDYFEEWRNIEVVEGFRLPRDRWLPGTTFDDFRTRTRIGALVHAQGRKWVQQSKRREYGSVSRTEPDLPVERSARGVLELAEVCRELGIPMGVLMIPARGKPTRHDSAFRTRLEQHGVPVVDLAGELGPEHYFRGDGHWTANGHRRAAELVAPFTARLLSGEIDIATPTLSDGEVLVARSGGRGGPPATDG